MTNLLGEFMGTMVLIFFGAGVVANCVLKESKAYGAGWICITTAWAFGVMFGVYTAVALGAPQADLNPAVTLAKTLMGVYTPGHAAVTSLAQLGGAFTGAVIAWLAFLPHWAVTDDPGAKRAIFCTTPAIRNLPANILCEVIATFFLIFLIFIIFHKNNGQLPPGYGPYMVALLVWALGLSYGGPTGYAMNPARDLGPRLAHFILPIPGKMDAGWDYAWVPVIAPLIGGGLAFGVGKLVGIL